MRRYRARDSDCPSCGRTPNVRFSGHQVRRCKRDRAAGHHTEVSCERCGRKYWIRNLQIANAVLDPSENGGPKTNGRRVRRGRRSPDLPTEFPYRVLLIDAGIQTVRDLRRVDDLTAIPGIATTRADEIRAALDAVGTKT